MFEYVFFLEGSCGFLFGTFNTVMGSVEITANTSVKWNPQFFLVFSNQNETKSCHESPNVTEFYISSRVAELVTRLRKYYL